VFAAAVVAEVKAIACELPATRSVPIGRWSLAELRAEVIASGLLAAVSTATVRRWLCRGCHQAVAAPLLDLPPRPRLCRQGRPGARPVRGQL
jgi:hypothetical protein